MARPCRLFLFRSSVKKIHRKGRQGKPGRAKPRWSECYVWRFGLTGIVLCTLCLAFDLPLRPWRPLRCVLSNIYLLFDLAGPGGIESRVYIGDFAGDAAGQFAAKERGDIANFLGGDVAAQRRLLF